MKQKQVRVGTEFGLARQGFGVTRRRDSGWPSDMGTETGFRKCDWCIRSEATTLPIMSVTDGMKK